MGKTAARFERVLVEQDGEVVAVGVRDELVRDMRPAIPNFLKDNITRASAGCRKDL